MEVALDSLGRLLNKLASHFSPCSTSAGLALLASFMTQMWVFWAPLLLQLAATARDAYEAELAALLASTTTTTSSAPLAFCTAGRFRNAYTEHCTDCPAGKFQRLTQSSECETCPWGRFQLRKGQIVCEASTCAAGTVPSWTGCATCPRGRSAALGATSCTSCDIAEGQYAFAVGEAECEQSECLMGYKQTRGGCVECHEDEFQLKVGQAWCLKCPTGFVSPRGSSTCYRSGAGDPDRVLAVHKPGALRRCSHVTCQYNGGHVQVTHDGREQHGGSHSCYYTGANHYADVGAHGDCTCMCKTNDLGDSLYMLIPHGAGSGSLHSPANPRAFTHAVVGHLAPSQIQSMRDLGIALPPCVGNCKSLWPTNKFDPSYHGFNGEIAQRQHEYLERGDQELHWARTGV